MRWKSEDRIAEERCSEATSGYGNAKRCGARKCDGNAERRMSGEGKARQRGVWQRKGESQNGNAEEQRGVAQ